MHIYSSDLKYMTVAIPPLPEQAAIVRFLDHADRRIGRYIGAMQKLFGAAASRTEREASLLGEYRSRLIADVVTGKLDVLGVAAGLPEPDAPADDDTPDGIRAVSGLDTRAEELAAGGVDVRHGEVEVRGAADAATVAWWGAEEAAAGDRR